MCSTICELSTVPTLFPHSTLPIFSPLILSVDRAPFAPIVTKKHWASAGDLFREADNLARSAFQGAPVFLSIMYILSGVGSDMALQGTDSLETLQEMGLPECDRV